jgi:hypothetical protein
MAAVAGVLAILLAVPAFAATSEDSGFEGDDGNLNVDSTFDWNGFYADNGATPPVRTSPTWTGTAPNRIGSATASGWKFTGIEDAQNSGTDNVFDGGVKQDNECAGVGAGPKPPNKDDLKRIYITNKTGADGHVYLGLAWARIPQNTTSSSAHVGFEFNQNDPDVVANRCVSTQTNGLVKRSFANGGDFLIVYDFEGGDSPVVLKLLRWKNTGTCEQTGKTATAAGCWVLDPTFTDWEAKVNTTTVEDKIAPAGTENLQTQEFGEAIVDLTPAVFPETPTDCLSFGRSFGVSRSSGNSGQAAMKDIVGPADTNIANCATVIIHKVTSPATDTTTSFSFTKNFATDDAVQVNTFSLTGGSCSPATTSCTKTYSGNVFPKVDARVTESDPSPLYLLTSITCTAGSTATNISTNSTTGTVNSVPARTVEFDIAAGQLLECTFTNTKQKQESAINTSPWVYPNDTATVTPTDATGTVTFKLYGGADAATALTNCQTNGATGLVYSETVSLPATAPLTVSTSNPGTTGTPTSYKIEADATVYWRVLYNGDSNYLRRLSSCVENIAVDVTAQTGGGTNVPD